jgi:hypothetical protein
MELETRRMMTSSRSDGVPNLRRVDAPSEISNLGAAEEARVTDAKRIISELGEEEAALRVLAHLDVRLLDLGGERVVHPIELYGGMYWMMTTVPVLDRGRPFPGTARQWYGERSDCHGNAAALWRAGWGTIVNGWALTKDDGLWRQHSWVQRPTGTLIETTDRRAQYYGYLLSENEARHFFEANPPGCEYRRNAGRAPRP